LVYGLRRALRMIFKKEKGSFVAILLLSLLLLSSLLASNKISSFSIPRDSPSFRSLLLASSAYSGSNITAFPPIREFEIPQNQSYPLGLVTDSHGDVWFGEAGIDNIEEFIPTNESFRTFHIPIPSQLAWIWTPVFDSGGYLWFTTTNGNDIWSLDPQSGQFENFSTGNTNTQPYALAYDAVSNKIWFTSFRSNQFGAFQLFGNGTASISKLYDLPVKQGSVSGSVGAGAIALDGKGNVYVSEAFVAQIAKFNESTGQLEHTWTLPRGSNPLGIAVDPRTDYVWFTNHATSFFGYIDQTSGKSTQYSTSPFLFNGNPEVTLPYWIYISSTGQIWFNEHGGNRIARFDVNSSTLTEFSVPTPNAEPIKLTLDDRRGLVWFAEFTGNKIGMLEQNDSLAPEISISKSSLNLTGSNVSVDVDVSSENLLPLNFSSTAAVTGVVGNNFTISSQKISNDQVNIRIARGSELSPGSYALTFCSNGALPVKYCRTVVITVEPETADYVDISIAAAAVVAAVVVSIYFVRRWRDRVH
jgi:streptogramin lyase